MSPSQSPRPPTPPPKDAPKSRKKKVKRPAPIDSNAKVPVEAHDQTSDMSSAVERRRRDKLPVTREGTVATLEASTKPVRVKARDLQPVKAPTPILAADQAISLATTFSGSLSPTNKPNMTNVKRANLPKMQARDELRPEPSNLCDLKEVLKSHEYEAEEDKFTLTLPPQSSMDWDSDDEQQRPGLRSMLGKLKRKSDESGNDETAGSRSELSPKGFPAIQYQSIASTMGLASSPPALSRVETLKSQVLGRNHSVEDFTLRFKRKIQGKASLQAATSSDLRSRAFTSKDDMSVVVRSPQSQSPHSLKLRPGTITDGTLEYRNDALLARRVPHDPWQPLPESPTATESKVAPWGCQTECDKREVVARKFIQQYPPPPVPATPTRSAGRSLRFAKSDSSMRTSATGARMAPPIEPARRTARVDIFNPDDSPGLYISKPAGSTGLPSSPQHPDWDAAIEKAKQEMKEAERMAKENKKRQKRTAEEEKQAQRALLKKHGDKIIGRASRFGYAPYVDWRAMTDQELQTFGWALQREIEQGPSSGVIKRMFRHVGLDKAHGEVIKHSFLNGQKRLLDRVVKDRSAARLNAENAQAGNHEVTQQADHVGDAARERLDHLSAQQGGKEQARRTALVESPEPDPTPDGRHAFLDRAVDDDTEYGDTEHERLRAYEALCKPSSSSNSDDIIGLGITGAAESVTARTMGTTARLGMRYEQKYTPSELDDFMNDATSTYSDDPIHPLSPFGEEPLKVSRSSTAPLDRYGRPVFQPERNDSFMRKIEDAADRARQLRRISSHPAMRGSAVQLELPPVPSTAPLITLGDVWDFGSDQESEKHDSLVRARLVEEADSSRSGSSSVALKTATTASMEFVNLPQLTLVTGGGSRTSFLDWNDDDEGYGTGPMEQQQFTDSVDGTVKDISALEFHDRLSRLSEYVSLQYPGRADDAVEEELEYVKNPDYDPSGDVISAYEQIDGVEEVDRQPLSSAVINVDIDDVIAEWEHRPRTHSSNAALSSSSINRNANMQALRMSVGLDKLKPHTQTERPRHPNHPFEWDTEKIMCRSLHTPVTDLPKFPGLPTGEKVQMRTASPGLYLTPKPMFGEQKQSVQRCERCAKFCCLYAENLLKSTIYGRTAEEVKVRLVAEEKAVKLRTFYPNGVEEYSTFLTCAECSRIVCPRCAKMCTESFCRQVMCRDCSRDAEGRCEIHELRFALPLRDGGVARFEVGGRQCGTFVKREPEVSNTGAGGGK